MEEHFEDGGALSPISYHSSLQKHMLYKQLLFYFALSVPSSEPRYLSFEEDSGAW